MYIYTHIYVWRCINPNGCFKWFDTINCHHSYQHLTKQAPRRHGLFSCSHIYRKRTSKTWGNKQLKLCKSFDHPKWFRFKFRTISRKMYEIKQNLFLKQTHWSWNSVSWTCSLWNLRKETRTANLAKQPKGSEHEHSFGVSPLWLHPWSTQQAPRWPGYALDLQWWISGSKGRFRDELSDLLVNVYVNMEDQHVLWKTHNFYIKNWKITMFFTGKLTISAGPCSIAM